MLGKRKAWIDTAGVTHAGEIWAVVGSFTVIECTCCKFKHVVPLPTPDNLQSVYSHQYYTQEKPMYIEHYLEDKAWWDAVYAERYARLEQHLGRQQGSILDVGSGPGFFLALGRERGWNVLGVEPSYRAAAYSQSTLKLDVHNIFLDRDTASTLGTFDVVHMGEVLEHLTNPAEFLNIAMDLLKPGGILLLVVPNDFNPLQILLRDHMNFEPWWVAPPHHLNYFNHGSLSSLVKRAGYHVLDVESTFPIDIFLLMGQNYINNDQVGRKVHESRKSFDQNLLLAGAAKLRQSFYRTLADIGIGREVVLYASKPGVKKT